tara:strand:+ start:182 stop:505 length:324 start_codon:yes stop_codon:yes gene_type:complete
MDANLSYIGSDGAGLDIARAPGKKEKEKIALVEVSWLDSYTASGWEEYAPENTLTKTYGILVDKNDTWVTLAMTKEEGYWGNLWYIPSQNVRSIKTIHTSNGATEES